MLTTLRNSIAINLIAALSVGFVVTASIGDANAAFKDEPQDVKDFAIVFWATQRCGFEMRDTAAASIGDIAIKVSNGDEEATKQVTDAANAFDKEAKKTGASARKICDTIYDNRPDLFK